MVYAKKSLIVNIALILVALAASYHAVRMVHNAMVMRIRSSETTQKIEQLKLEKKELEAQIMELQTKEAIEREAKERLNLKNPGEQVVVIVPEKKDNPSPSPNVSLWEKFKSFFKI